MNNHERFIACMALENLERLHQRAGHTPAEDGEREYPGFCVACDQEWPCEVMVAHDLATRYLGLD